MIGDERETRRLREAFASTSPDDAPTQACPSPSILWEAARGELEARKVREILDHVAVCTTCTDAWRLASAISGDRLGDTAGAHRSGRHGFGATSRVGWTAAAAAAGAFLVFSLGYDGSTPAATISRSAGTELAPRELRLVGVEASPSHCQFTWTSFEGATYDVSLLSQESELLEESLNQRQATFAVGEPVLAAVGDSLLQLHVRVRKDLEGVVAEDLFDVRCVSK